MKLSIGILLFLYCVTCFAATLSLANFHPLQSYALAEPRVQRQTTIDAPHFASIKDAKHKKSRFLNFLAPFIEEENERLLRQREVLLSIKEKKAHERELTDQETRIIAFYAQRYDLDSTSSDSDKLKELLLRVNMVPTSLALAQAAIESGWGTSRFARQGNNYFGQWCYSAECGMIPKRRAKHQQHQLQQFDSPADSVRSYMHNLNTHSAYSHLRKLRADMADSGETINGAALTEGLISYSQRRERYIEEVKRMIRRENLARY